MPQRETRSIASAPGPCNYLQVWLSHTLHTLPLEMWAPLHTEGNSSSHSPDSGTWPRTLQRASVNPLQSDFSSRQEYRPDLPHPPTKEKQQTCPLQRISRAPEDQGDIWFHLNTGQTDVINKQQLGIISTCLEGVSKPDTKGPISQSCILSSIVIHHTSQLHLGAFSVAIILFRKLFQIIFNRLNSSL